MRQKISRERRKAIMERRGERQRARVGGDPARYDKGKNYTGEQLRTLRERNGHSKMK